MCLCLSRNQVTSQDSGAGAEFFEMQLQAQGRASTRIKHVAILTSDMEMRVAPHWCVLAANGGDGVLIVLLVTVETWEDHLTTGRLGFYKTLKVSWKIHVMGLEHIFTARNKWIPQTNAAPRQKK